MAVILETDTWTVFKFEETGLAALILETADELLKRYPNGNFPEVTYERDKFDSHVFRIWGSYYE